ERVALAGKIVVGRQMNDRSDVRTVPVADEFQSLLEAALGREVHVDAIGARGRMRRPGLVDADNSKSPCEPPGEGRADQAAAAGDQNGGSARFHAALRDVDPPDILRAAVWRSTGVVYHPADHEVGHRGIPQAGLRSNGFRGAETSGAEGLSVGTYAGWSG